MYDLKTSFVPDFVFIHWTKYSFFQERILLQVFTTDLAQGVGASVESIKWNLMVIENLN